MVRRKIKEFIAGDEELRSVFDRNALAEVTANTKERLIARSAIACTFTFRPDRKPMRHYYDSVELERWALNDIGPNGIHSPLWVRPHPTMPGSYELVAGLRRWKAAEILNLETVPAKVFEWDDATAFQAAVSENANRRGFSALEDLDNTLGLLEIALGYEKEEVLSLLFRMNNANKNKGNPEIFSSSEAKLVEQVFNSFGLISWKSFVTTRLPLLKKPEDVLKRIRTGEIEYTKGIAIASLKTEEDRETLLEEAIRESLSLAQIKEKIQEIKAQDAENNQKPKNLKNRFGKVISLAKKDKKIWGDPKKIRQIEKLLRQLEGMLEGSASPESSSDN
jgi:ParB family chromosome partitioning protein